MSQIRSDILYTRKIKEARNCDQEMLRLHIATPICPDNEIEEYELDNEEYIQVSDDDMISDKEADDEMEINNDSNDEQKWDQIIKEWIELGNQFENQDDAIFLSEEWNNDFNLGGHEIHPADDETAKWILSSLFESSLESPSFLNFNKIISNV